MENNVISLNVKKEIDKEILQKILLCTDFTDREYLKNFMLTQSDLIYFLYFLPCYAIVLDQKFFSYNKRISPHDAIERVIFFVDCSTKDGNIVDNYNKIGFLHFSCPYTVTDISVSVSEIEKEKHHRGHISKNNPCNPDDDFISIKCKDIISLKKELNDSLRWIYKEDIPSGLKGILKFTKQLFDYRNGNFNINDKVKKLIKLINNFEKLEGSPISDYDNDNIYF